MKRSIGRGAGKRERERGGGEREREEEGGGEERDREGKARKIKLFCTAGPAMQPLLQN